jgi:type IV secretion system protein TrbF
LRPSYKEVAVRWFTIAPIKTDRFETARMTRNMISIKAQAMGASANQRAGWLRSDAPFQAISANPERALEKLP